MVDREGALRRSCTSDEERSGVLINGCTDDNKPGSYNKSQHTLHSQSYKHLRAYANTPAFPAPWNSEPFKTMNLVLKLLTEDKRRFIVAVFWDRHDKRQFGVEIRRSRVQVGRTKEGHRRK